MSSRRSPRNRPNAVTTVPTPPQAPPAAVVFVGVEAVAVAAPTTAAVARGGNGSHAAAPSSQGLRWGPATRGATAVTAPPAAPARVHAVPGRDVVALSLENGPTLWLHPEVARDVLQGQGASPAGAVSTRGSDAAVAVTHELPWPTHDAAPPAAGTTSRGVARRVLLAGLDVITGGAADALRDLAADQAAQLVAQRVDAQVHEGTGGLYPLGRKAFGKLKDSGTLPLTALPPAAAAGPVLVFIHGTFSNTAQCFGKLWSDHGGIVERLLAHYGQRVYGFDHPTLRVSPAHNALELARALPEGAVLHLVTHSRGGLVAEVLARAAASTAVDQGEGFVDFCAEERRTLSELATLLRQRRVQVQRVVRVACPADGTVLASKRLDAYLSVFKWAVELSGLPLVPEVVDFISTVAQRRADAHMLPGLAAQVPDSPLVRWLRSTHCAPLAGDLRVIAGDVQGDSLGSWLKVLLADGFFLEDHDYVVDTDAMMGGAPRALAPVMLLDRGGAVGHGRYFSNPKTAAAVLAALTTEHATPVGFGPLPRRAARGGSAAATAPMGAARGLPLAPAPAVPLAIELVNGNLMFTRQPLVVGHYRSTELEGSERVVNNLIGDGMTQALRVGIYPDGPGSFQMFRNVNSSDNPLQMPRPSWAIVVGLGDESDLKPDRLVHTLRQAIVAWSQRLHEGVLASQQPDSSQRLNPPPRPLSNPSQFELASVLVASGGTRISPGTSAQLIAQAAHEANVRLRQCTWPVLSKLVLVELYLDRATEAWRALNSLAAAQPGRWQVGSYIQDGAGALRRPLDTNYRGAEYDLISATSEGDSQGDAAIAFTLDTRRARSEVRAQATQPRLVRELVKRASTDSHQDPQLGRTLFQLLVPVELEPHFGGNTEMRIELDSGTAAIPWELLQDRIGHNPDDLPWAVRTKLIRKLRTVRFRQTVSDATGDAGALVIGEPAVTDPDRHGRLPGARHEAQTVAKQLAHKFEDAQLRTLIAPDDVGPLPSAQQVINALLERDWRIVHIAGHGEAPKKNDPRGVVLSDGCYLGYREIRTMRTVPELVFINCCHLAERPVEQVLQRETLTAGDYSPPQFAATVAEELIELGVRCVVAAGWAVEDEPAAAFASAFYRAIVSGERFIDAVEQARKAAWDQRGQGNTWAAYQCYGDPEWRLSRHVIGRRPQPPEIRFAGIASPLGLTIALEAVATDTKYLSAVDRPRRIETQRSRLEWLRQRFENPWGAMGAVAEAFGVAYRELGHTVEALAWFERARAAEDGSASQSVTEQAANLRARAAEAAFDKAFDTAFDKATQARSRRATAQPLHEDPALQRAAQTARNELQKAHALIHALIALAPTMERWCVAGSASKRLALVEQRMQCHDAALAAVRHMKDEYGQAERIARQHRLPRLHYPALNRLAAELVVDASRPGWRGFVRSELDAVADALRSTTAHEADFWSVSGQTELLVYEAVAGKTLAAQLATLQASHDHLHQRISSPRDWQSVEVTTRFVLDSYGRRASAAEQAACETLLQQLQSYAKP